MEEIQIEGYVAALSMDKEAWYFGRVTEKNASNNEIIIHLFSPDGMSVSKAGYRLTCDHLLIVELRDVLKIVKTFKPTTKAGRFFNAEAKEMKEIEELFMNGKIFTKTLALKKDCGRGNIFRGIPVNVESVLFC